MILVAFPSAAFSKASSDLIANGKTESGHFLKISFTEEDFEAEAILSDFSIEFYLLAENGEEIFAGKKTFAASFAEGYQMGVSGDRKTDQDKKFVAVCFSGYRAQKRFRNHNKEKPR